MKLNNYDAIASNYDMLSRMVFFKSQVKAQIAQIKFIPSRSNILIVGGGTGWILEEISKVYSEGLKITYVEISEKMIRLASKRSAKGNILEFVNLPIEDFLDDCRYDVVITAFLFDNFKEERIQQVFSKLNHMLKPSGLWLFSDFEHPENGGSKWQEWLLNTMYYFFGKIAHVEATALIPVRPYFMAKNYKSLDIQMYYQGFIKAIVYKKSA